MRAAASGALKVEMQRAGRPVKDFDLIIASTALILNYRPVTRNEKHFKGIPGVVLENRTR